jgi:hypothetical protein
MGHSPSDSGSTQLGERGVEMRNNRQGMVLAAILGAIGGGIFVLLVGEIIPRIMQEMMRGMMAEMGGEGCDPEDM